VKIEPGYYKAGDFGVRIESILRVVNTTFKVISFKITISKEIFFLTDLM
jgi:Xaa-Pro aminopeptidase